MPSTIRLYKRLNNLIRQEVTRRGYCISKAIGTCNDRRYNEIVDEMDSITKTLKERLKLD